MSCRISILFTTALYAKFTADVFVVAASVRRVTFTVQFAKSLRRLPMHRQSSFVKIRDMTSFRFCPFLRLTIHSWVTCSAVCFRGRKRKKSGCNCLHSELIIFPTSCFKRLHPSVNQGLHLHPRQVHSGFATR